MFITPPQDPSVGLIFPLYRRQARPLGLRLRVARHQDAAAALQHLGKTGTIVAETGCAAPGIRHAQEPPGQRQHFGDGEHLHVESHVSGLDPAGTVVGQAHLQPAVLRRRFGNGFQAGFKRHGEQRRVRGDAGFAIDMREQADHLRGAIGGGIGRPRPQQGKRCPASVIVGRANVGPTLALFQQRDVRAIDGL